MKSNRCLFNKTVFASDFKRFLPFAIPLLIANIIFFPVIIFDQYGLPNYPLNMDDFMAHSIACDVLSFIFAGVFALVVFSYLYNPRMSITIHSFPVGRKQLFATSFLAGYVMLILPQLIGFALAIPKIHTSSKIAGQLILFQIVSILLMSFIFYTSAVLSVMLAGNIFAGAVIYLVINFVCYAVWAAFNALTSYIGFGLFSSVDDDFIYGKLPYSPLIDSILGKSNDIMSTSKAVLAESNVKSLTSVLVYYIVVSVVLVIVSYLLYKARKLECAGDMVAFNIETPVLSVVVSVVGAAAASLLLNEMLDFNSTMLLIAFAIFVLIGFFLTQMILRKKANVFKLKTVILGVLTCVIATAVIFGAAKYKTNYIPSADKVEKVTVNASYDMVITDKTDIDFVREFHKAMIKNTEENGRTDYPFRRYDWIESDEMVSRDSMYRTYSISVDYQLKNGKSVQRRYFLSSDEKELLTKLSALEERYHPVSVLDTLEGIKFEIQYITFEKTGVNGYEHFTVPTSDCYKLLEAVRADSKQKLENYKTVLNEEYYYSEDPEYAGYDITIACIATDEASLKKLSDGDMYRSDPSKMYMNANSWYDDTLDDYVANENFLLNYSIEASEYESELYKLLESYEAE